MYLLWLHTSNGTVSPKDVKEMVGLTPTKRLMRIQNGRGSIAGSEGERFVELIGEVLGDYARFLQLTHKKKEELLLEYDSNVDAWKADSYSFGRKFAEALAILGQSKHPFNGLYRIILI